MTRISSRGSPGIPERARTQKATHKSTPIVAVVSSSATQSLWNDTCRQSAQPKSGLAGCMT